MNKKKALGWIMLCMIIIQSIPMQLEAKTQNNVSQVEITDITHTQEQSGKMKPNIDLLWEEPDSETEDYQIELREYATNTKVYTTNYKAKGEILNTGNNKIVTLQDLIFKQDPSYRLKNGTYYQVGVRGRHTHLTQNNGTTVTTIHESAGIEPIYFITDFDTQVTAINQGLTVEWEYIPGANYKLVLAPGDWTTKEQVDKSPLKEVKTITDSQVIEGKLVNQNNKVSYTINHLTPMESYAVYVEVDGFTVNAAGQNVEFLQNRFKDERGPKVARAMPKISLEITDIGQSKIEIYWGQINWAETTGKLKKVQVYATTNGRRELIAEKNKLLGYTLDSIVVDKPLQSTLYEVVFVIEGYSEIISEAKLYTPSELLIKPLNPKVPKPYSSNTLMPGLIQEYLVSDDRISIGNSQFINHTFHAQVGDGVQVQLVWDAPKKQDKSGSIDYALLYDIWVSDQFNLLQDTSKIEPIKANVSITEAMKDSLITQVDNVQEVIGMKVLLEDYLSGSTDSNTVVKNKMTTNSVYYIKIVAKRHLLDHAYIESDATIVSIKLDEQGHIQTPVVMGKPPLRIQPNGGVTTNSITIEWLTKWQELIAKDEALTLYEEEELELAQLGHTKVYLPKVENKNQTTLQPPYIHFKTYPGWEAVSAYTKYQIEGPGGIKQRVEALGGENAFKDHYYTKEVVLESDIAYELKVLPYNDIPLNASQSIEEWIVATQKDSVEGWLEIQPQEGTKESPEVTWKAYPIQNLQENTRYVVMLRAYRITETGEKLIQSFPSYIIETTLKTATTPEVHPTVPTLSVKSFTDTEIVVEWTYNKAFQYELVYSTGDDPSQAKPWPFTISDNPLDQNYVEDGKKATIKITGLFPETNYNVWIRAKQKQGTIQSEFSNPVNVTTKPLQVPQVPTGLGPASAQSLFEVNGELKPIGPDYITVEWNKDLNDLGTQVEGSIQKSYEYDLEFADNVEFLDSQVVTVKDTLGSGNNYTILAKDLVSFTKLIANRPYYVRIKARVNLIDTTTGRTISKASEYSTWVRIFTKTSSGEYDGGENDNIITYPNPIEETYSKGEWTIEFVDTGKIISEIKTSKDYFYTITMKTYKDRYEPDVRRIKIPVSIIEALSTSRMELKIETQKGIYEIPTQAMGYYVEKASAKDLIQIELTEMIASELADVAMPFPYFIQSAEKLSIGLRSQTLTKSPMERFDGKIKVALKLGTNNSYKTTTLKTYTYDYSYGGWLQNSYKIDTKSDATYAVYSTASTGVYTLQSIINYADYKNTTPSMDQLLARYNIEKLGTQYTKDTKVYSDQMISLLMGIARNYVDIHLDSTTSDLRNKAKNAGFYIEDQGGFVTQEQALHAVVRLYEAQTGNRIKPSTVLLDGVSPKYKESVQKAYALGLINQVEPHEVINYGQLASLLVLVLP